MKELKANFKENDNGRNWYIVDGCHDGTELEFDNQEFARAENGAILDSDGCALTPGDWDHIAVNSVLPEYQDIDLEKEVQENVDCFELELNVITKIPRRIAKQFLDGMDARDNLYMQICNVAGSLVIYYSLVSYSGEFSSEDISRWNHLKTLNHCKTITKKSFNNHPRKNLFSINLEANRG
jgi:hypothetical protein